MEHIPSGAGQGFGAELFVVGGAPDVGGDVVTLSQDFLGGESAADEGTAAEKVGLMFLAGWARFELVEPFEDAVRHALRHGGHREILVVEGDVVEKALVLL